MQATSPAVSCCAASTARRLRTLSDGGRARALILALGLALLASDSLGADSFVTFETGQARPLALSPDGNRLFVVNTPDARLEIFDITKEGLDHLGAVPVGLEPLAVAARTSSEVWVVNHLSDSISIVDVASDPPRVVRTLLVCDEPRDIVFGGPGGNRAFVTTARRGQNCPVAPELSTPGLGRALVMVFDALNLGPAFGGTPMTTLELFGDTPRALAVTPDGSTVYAAVFHSGNQTTSLNQLVVCDGTTDPFCEQRVSGFELPTGLPAPTANVEGVEGQKVGLIVKLNRETGVWEDELARDWSEAVRFNLPDKDVFAIDATADPPVEIADYQHVGTVLYNMAVNPVSGALYVSNTDARNEVRFIGSNSPTTTVRGHLHESNITVIDEAGVHPRHLNKHIDYSLLDVPPGVKERSIALPTGMVVSADGSTLYLAAFGSSRVAVYSTNELESDTFVPTAEGHYTVGGGPSGLALDDSGRLYVFTRFSNAVEVIDTFSGTTVDREVLHNPEPHRVVVGRRFLYDAVATTSNGETPCGGCHVFGDFDSLAWDLGDPMGFVAPNLNPARNPPADWHPLKGPMITQSLRGLAHAGPLHTRGDKTGLDDTPPSDALDVIAAFRTFNGAFDVLMGRSEGPIPEIDMTKFANFALEIDYPPNPIRALDNSFTPSEALGLQLYNLDGLVFEPNTPEHQSCVGCHPVNAALGFFGANGTTTNGVRQWFKTPHFRNQYQKVGMFGMLDVIIFFTDDIAHKGDQVRGFGFDHAGTTDALFRFNHYFLFAYMGTEAEVEQQRMGLTDYMFSFPSKLSPIVGQQVTLTSTNAVTVGSRIDLMITRAGVDAPSPEHPDGKECDLIVKGNVNGEARGWRLTEAGVFESDRVADPLSSDAALRALAATPSQELTYTCAPFGSGLRMALDRDEDGAYDRDELDAGTNPAPEPEIFLLHVAALASILVLRRRRSPRGVS